jgi:hypothetical protein
VRKTKSLRLLGLCLVLTSLVVGAVITATRKHAQASDSIQTVAVSSSGERLTTLFEGLPRDPRYSLRDILASRRALPKCSGKPGILDRLFGSAVVHAGCPYLDCAGSGWTDMDTNCDTGGGCSGTHYFITTDPTSDSGYFGDHTHCGSLPECGCNLFSCG